MKTSITVYTISNPESLFAEGSPLYGFDSSALSGGEDEGDYGTSRGRALFAALDSKPEYDDELILGRLPDGRWAIVGMSVEGHRFAVEDVEPPAYDFVALGGDYYAVEFAPSYQGGRIVRCSEPISYRHIERQPDASEYHLSAENAEWLDQQKWTTLEFELRSWKESEGAVAWKFADPTEEARWIYDEAEAERIAREDPALIAWRPGR